MESVIAGLLLCARLLLGFIFIFSAIAKLRDVTGTGGMLRDFGVPAAAVGASALLLPIVECAIGAGTIVAVAARWGALAAAVLLALFTGAMAFHLARGHRPKCRCFGQREAKPVGAGTIVRNVLLCALALAIAIAAPGSSDALAVRTLTDHVGLAIGAAAIVSVFAVQTLLLFQILRQQGRLLLRIDALSGTHGESRFENEPADVMQGLPVGTPAPTFDLSAVAGGRLTLNELLGYGKRVVLFFVHPSCGPCRALLPNVARWYEGAGNRLTFAVISEGSVDENRRFAQGHALPPFALQESLAVSEAFGVYGTPAAVLLEADGRVASAVASGEEHIEKLMTEAQPPLAKGEAIPELLGVSDEGHEVRLATRDTALVFWNAQCGYCKAAVDELLAIGRKLRERLVVVAPETDADLVDGGLRGRLLIDPTGKLGRLFGANGTPMAVRIGADGSVASDVAAGKDAVMPLLEAVANA